MAICVTTNIYEKHLLEAKVYTGLQKRNLKQMHIPDVVSKTDGGLNFHPVTLVANVI